MAGLNEIAKERIIVLDGGMGTMLQQYHLTAKDYGGAEYEGCPEMLNIHRPDVVREIHEAYFKAGADMVESNTFGGSSIPLSEYNLQDRAREINIAGIKIAREAAEKFSTPDRPRFVAASIGPGTKSLSVTGGTTFDEVVDAYYEQGLALIEAGADAFLLETCQDTLNVKAAAIGLLKAREELKSTTPLMVSLTVERTGSMLAGQGVEAAYSSLRHLGLFSIGLNCATGPEFMTDKIRALSELAECYVSVYPNAGLPNEEGKYKESPQSLAGKLERFVDEGWVNVIGGCCGTTPAHIQAIAEMVRGKKTRVPSSKKVPAVSGIDYLEIEDQGRPYIIGERTNVIGSRIFKDLITQGKYEEGSEIARRQAKGGASIIDVCLANPDRNEYEDMEKFLPFVVKKVKSAIMIDSTDSNVMEMALKRTQGKSIINSINLEDGEERFQRVCPIIRKYGAAVVVGCIDDDPQHGMAVTAQRKLEVARRSHELLTGKYGVPEEDIFFDPLVFPVGTGDANYIGSARETIEGVRLISMEFPRCHTTLGISNVSFGLPQAGREVLNAVFLYHCVKAGLTSAIVNSEKLHRYASLSEEEKELSEDLIFWRLTEKNNRDPVAAFAAHFRDKKPAAKAPKDTIPLEARLADYIIEGSKDGLAEDLDEAMKKMKPLDIINGPLMAGMDEVGRLFNDNKLIVAEVLQSAESMKAAVTRLESFMEKGAAEKKGKVILATVKGDVHDIGKNLVEIILGNNGFEIMNLGIKIDSNTLIEAQRKHKADIIGLSGLLVKSALQMAATASDFKNAGIDVPVIVGGAALSSKFTYSKIAPAYGHPVFYARDAMDGLSLANKLSGEGREALLLEGKEMVKRAMDGTAAPDKKEETPAAALPRRSGLASTNPVLPPPDYETHVLKEIDLRAVFSFINPLMLYGRHLGLKGSLEKLLKKGDPKARELQKIVTALQEEVIAKKLLRAEAVYRYFPAMGDGDDLIIYDPADQAREIERFKFERMKKEPYLCISDFARPLGSGEKDNIAIFVTTAGKGVRELAEKYKADGEYLKSHALQALALESAEAAAEWLHKELRLKWGIVDDPALSMNDVFQAKYQGIRVSFGYPACPNLADQEKLWRLLDPERQIGVKLTEGMMMDPEASVSALAFHHPEGQYFSV